MGDGQAEGQSGDPESQIPRVNHSWLLPAGFGSSWGVKPRNAVTLPRCVVLVPKQIRFCASLVHETHFALRPWR